ncbi:hypothetical protein CASFOL_000353 [Castilleja foliolosa]|uniref:Uncharacterized protein n=1 Tax=Castilleja foliolosa TaxID=1961234 RepID=A0ABD3EQL5_9LAMI
MSIIVSSFLWRLPISVMNYGVTFLNLGSPIAPERSARRRPLQTCGASILAIAQKSCTKLQDLDGPFGSTVTRAISFMSSFVAFIYIFMYPFIAMTSYIDDRILSFETKAESIFPLSTLLFDKIDNLVSSSESLPDHVDDAFEKIRLLMHWIPFLERIISLLNRVLSIVTHLGTRNTSGKEIAVDSTANSSETSNVMDLEELVKSYSDRRTNNHTEFEVIQKSVDRLRFLRNRIKTLEDPHFVDSPMYASYQSANSSPVSDCSDGEAGPFNYPTNYSYKEILLEKGQKDDEGEEKAETAGKSSNEGTTTTDSNEKSKLA